MSHCWEQVFRPRNPKGTGEAAWKVERNRWREARSPAGIKTREIKAEDRKPGPGSAAGISPASGSWADGCGASGLSSERLQVPFTKSTPRD